MNIQKDFKKIDRDIACNLNYDGNQFPIGEKEFQKVEVQNNICINVFCYEDKMVFPIMCLIQDLKTP